LTGCGLEAEGTDPVTSQGELTTSLFNLTLVLGGLVFLLVIGLLAYSIVRFGERPGDDEPEQTHENRRLEIAWTATPFLLLTVLFVLTVRTMWRVDDPPERDEGLTIEIIGHQWWWEYRYPDQQVIIANELHLPTGTPIRMELRSADVVHSFWVPRFGWKLDVIPNKTNVLTIEADVPGTYDGACAEYCLDQHAWMRTRVVVEAPEQFAAWLQAQAQPAVTPADDQARRGEDIYMASTCVNCHRIAGTPSDGNVGPDLTHLGSRTILGAGIRPNTPEELADWIRDAGAIKPGVLMPRYDFSDEDLAALVRYLDGLK
jgi:cytochrome c oxidase subunit 2